MDDDAHAPAEASAIEVQPLIIPWELSGIESSDESDPIPKEVRDRFSPNNRPQRHRNPVFVNTPLYGVKPGEDLLWGSTELELMNRLRTGIVTIAKLRGSYVMAKIEASDGNVERAYIKFEALFNADYLELYKDMYGLSLENGDLSKRAAASYEFAKAAGLDDLVPPTVYRFDEHDGLEPILSLDALDWLAQQRGITVEELRRQLGRSAAVELWSDGQEHLMSTKWYSDLQDGAIDQNELWVNCPYRSELLRGAILDFLLWTGTRSWADVMCCDNPRHRIHLINNDITFPNPVAMGTAYVEYSGDYTNGCPELQYAPMLWSDLVAAVAIRGYAEEARIYEEIAANVTARLRGDRLLELVRSMADHGISPLNIAATLVRIAFLRYGHAVVMRNPLVVCGYFSSILTGVEFDPGFDIDISSMEESINKILGQVLVTDFDFRQEMQKVPDEA